MNIVDYVRKALMIYDESIIKEDIKKLEAREFYIKYIINPMVS